MIDFIVHPQPLHRNPVHRPRRRTGHSREPQYACGTGRPPIRTRETCFIAAASINALHPSRPSKDASKERSLAFFAIALSSGPTDCKAKAEPLRMSGTTDEHTGAMADDDTFNAFPLAQAEQVAASGGFVSLATSMVRDPKP